jgi:3-oxoacyl-[acyl-carrier-protein] synthase II
MLGHTMGSASAAEAIACCMAMADGVIPPTINYENPDPDCDIDCVPNVARRKAVDIALNNSFAFGGNNACVIFGKYKN